MIAWGLNRVLALFVTAVIVYFTHFANFGDYGIYWFLAILGALLVPHYYMGFHASYPNFKKLLQYNKGRIAIFLWVFLSLLGFHYEPEIIVFLFGIHFVFSEAYSKVFLDKNYEFFTKKNNYRTAFTVLHCLFLFWGYICVSSHFVKLVEKLWLFDLFTTPAISVPLFAVFTFLYFGYLLLYSEKVFGEKVSQKEIIMAFWVPDILMTASFIFGYYYSLNYSVWILYHIIQWILLPVPKLMLNWKTPRSMIIKYALPSMAMCILFIAAYPFGFTQSVTAASLGIKPLPLTYTLHIRDPQSYPAGQRFSPYAYYYGARLDKRQFEFYREIQRWGWLHILSAFIFSSLNPAFIRRLIKP